MDASPREMRPDGAGPPERQPADAGTTVADAPPDPVTHALAQLRLELGKTRTELAQARQSLEEQACRNRNLFAVTAILIRRALDGAADLAAARAALEDLPARLAAALDAPPQGDPPPRSFGALATLALSGFAAAPRLRMSGPGVLLAPQAQALMARVLSELGTNAVKHGALGHAEGSVRLAWDATPDGGLRIVWSETGPERAAPAGRQGRGARLLLEVREKLGGALGLELRSDGMRVEIVLPPRQVERVATAGMPQRALVVESNGLIAADLAELLRQQGVAEIATAADPDAAAGRLAASPYDLVLLDLQPGALRVAEAAATTPLILLSGQNAGEPPAALLDRPLLRKPCEPRELAAALARLREQPPA